MPPTTATRRVPRTRYLATRIVGPVTIHAGPRNTLARRVRRPGTVQGRCAPGGVSVPFGGTPITWSLNGAPCWRPAVRLNVRPGPLPPSRLRTRRSPRPLGATWTAADAAPCPSRSSRTRRYPRRPGFDTCQMTLLRLRRPGRLQVAWSGAGQVDEAPRPPGSPGDRRKREDHRSVRAMSSWSRAAARQNLPQGREGGRVSGQGGCGQGSSGRDPGRALVRRITSGDRRPGHPEHRPHDRSAKSGDPISSRGHRARTSARIDHPGRHGEGSGRVLPRQIERAPQQLRPMRVLNGTDADLAWRPRRRRRADGQLVPAGRGLLRRQIQSSTPSGVHIPFTHDYMDAWPRRTMEPRTWIGPWASP